MLTKQAFVPLLSHNPHVERVIGAGPRRLAYRAWPLSSEPCGSLIGSICTTAFGAVLFGARARPLAYLSQAPAGPSAPDPCQAQSISRSPAGAGTLFLRGSAAWTWCPMARPRSSLLAPEADRAGRDWLAKAGLGHERPVDCRRAWRGPRHQTLAAGALATIGSPPIGEGGFDAVIVGGPDDAGSGSGALSQGEGSGRKRGRSVRIQGTGGLAPPLGCPGLRRYRGHAYGNRGRHPGRGTLRPHRRSLRILSVHQPRQRVGARPVLPAVQQQGRSSMSAGPSPLPGRHRL